MLVRKITAKAVWRNPWKLQREIEDNLAREVSFNVVILFVIAALSILLTIP